MSQDDNNENIADETTISTMPDDDGTGSDSSPDANDDDDGNSEDNNNDEIDPDSSADSLNTEGEDDSDDNLSDEEKLAKKEKEAADQLIEDGKRLDQHPRFKQLVADKNKVVLQMKALQAQKAANPGNIRDFAAEKLAIKDKLNSGDIDLDKYSTQIEGLVNEEAQLVKDADTAKATADADHAENTKLFLKEFPYIDEILEKQADDVELLIGMNPLHDKVTAAMALHIQSLTEQNQEKIDAAVKEAVEAAEKKFNKNAAAKKRASGLDKGNRSVKDGDDSDLNAKSPTDLRTNVARALDESRSQA